MVREPIIDTLLVVMVGLLTYWVIQVVFFAPPPPPERGE
jgi:hypothetical protein